MIHHDWKPVDMSSRLTLVFAQLNVVESWFNFELYACVTQNRHDGKWYYSLDLGKPDMRAPCNTRHWAMLMAQAARERRPEIDDPTGVHAMGMALCGIRDALGGVVDSLGALHRGLSHHG